MKTKKNFKKILVSIGLLAVAVPSALSVVACGGVHKIVDKSQLSKIVTKTNLGDLSDIDASTILAAVESKNPNAVGKVQVDEQSITTKDAKVIPSTDEYPGFVIVNFRFSSNAPFLNTIISNRNLGLLVDNKPDTILEKVVALNSAAADKIRVKSIDQEKNLATIVAINPEEYQGSVDVSFSLGELTEQDVVNAINLAPYFRAVLLNSKVDDLVEANFIKQNIVNQLVKEFFKVELFHLNSIIKDDFLILTDADLKNPTPRITTTINYNYGAIKNENVRLTIEVRESALPISKVRGDWALKNLKNTEIGTSEREISWFDYLYALATDFKYYDYLGFTNEELSNEQMIQTIIHEQFKLTIEADLLEYEIEKDYDPWSIKFDLLGFFIKVEPEEKSFGYVVNIEMKILRDDIYVPVYSRMINIIDGSYNLIDEKA